ncbi:DUF3795 domain-containing protein [Candidatus Bathyarchaeota archaeon]|nr:DUF3795 domain-containing protein [Candidatus Bathyarchaeota archaeon]
MQEKAYEAVKDQAGPCGITCGSCVLGNGTIAETAGKAKTYIQGYGIKEWAPMVPGGAELNWEETEKALDWMSKNSYCPGCEKGGGPPDCSIRACANEKSIELCSQCDELEGCGKYDWLGGHAAVLKQTLKENKGKTKEQFIADALGSQ